MKSSGSVDGRGDPAPIAFARAEYGALADEFARLAADFGHRVPPELRHDIARLASAIETIDRRVDEAIDEAERQSRWHWTVQALGDAGLVHDDEPVPSELVAAVRDLRALASERNVLPRVRRIVRDEARTSEAIRIARRVPVYVRMVEREGRLTAALALLVAGHACGRPFRRFFFRLAAPANLVDKILDARDDHARGEIVVVPGPRLYAALGFALARRAVMLAFTSTRPLLIARLALRYLGPSRAA